MSYEKNVWSRGDVVTSAKLNNIEDGIKALDEASGGGGVLVVGTTAEGEVETLTKTAQEINDALEDGMVFVKVDASSFGPDTEGYLYMPIAIAGSTEIDDVSYFVFMVSGPDGTPTSFFALNSSDYPSTALPSQDDPIE